MPKRKHDFVNLVYETAIETANWQAVADYYTDRFPGTSFSLNKHTVADHREVTQIFSGFDEAYIEKYDAYFVHVNPILDLVDGALPNDCFFRDTLLGRDSFEKTEYYNEWCKPQNDLITSVGCVVNKRGNEILATSHLIPRAREKELSTVIFEVAVQTTPHIARASAISTILAKSKIDISNIENAIDQLDVAVFILDKSQYVTFANNAARYLIDNKSGLIIDRSGRLSASHGDSNDRLADSLDSVFSSRHPSPAFNIVHPRGMLPLTVVALKFGRDSDWQSKFDAMFSDQSENVCLFVFDSNIRRQPLDQIVSHAFSLTPAQTRLALALARGVMLKDYADQVGISRNTARNHLAAIMAKMGISRQSELVSVVAQFSSIIVPPK